MFNKRHYDWLAHWAADTLSPAQVAALASALGRDNPRFNSDRFIEAVCRSAGSPVIINLTKERARRYVPHPRIVQE